MVWFDCSSHTWQFVFFLKGIRSVSIFPNWVWYVFNWHICFKNTGTRPKVWDIDTKIFCVIKMCSIFFFFFEYKSINLDWYRSITILVQPQDLKKRSIAIPKDTKIMISFIICWFLVPMHTTAFYQRIPFLWVLLFMLDDFHTVSCFSFISNKFLNLFVCLI